MNRSKVRNTLYNILSICFTYPGEEVFSWILEGKWLEEMKEALTFLGEESFENSNTVKGLTDGGQRKFLVDLSAVGYVDSATIGCLMDLYRQMSAAGGAFKLSGVQRRVETMLTMTGAQNFIHVHQDEAVALKSFGGPHAHN